MRLTQFSSTRFSLRCCENSGRPRRFRSPKSVHSSKKWVRGEAAYPQRDAMSQPTFAVVKYGYPPDRESYLNINSVDENDGDTEQESELPHLF